MNKYNTILGQLLGAIPRPEFRKLVYKHQTDKYSKKLNTWTHFVAMSFAQLTNQNGLRSIASSLNQQNTTFYHLGKCQEVHRSTLAFANNNRSSAFFEELFYILVNKINTQRKEFTFKNPLYAIDATTIDLCMKLFSWAEFRTTKAGVKLHTKFDVKKEIPCFVEISNAKKHENSTLKDMRLKKGDSATFDRGYINYEQFAEFCEQNIYFVTRLKDNADYDSIETRELPTDAPHITADHIIQLTGRKAKKQCSHNLRKVVSVDEKTKKSITILTNITDMSADTIADIYKNRWQIELFFKTIKQNLKIKKFFGTSENAVRIQIWVALIMFLLFSLLRNESKKFQNSFTRFISELNSVIFQRRDLREWLTGIPPLITKPFFSPELRFS